MKFRFSLGPSPLVIVLACLIGCSVGCRKSQVEEEAVIEVPAVVATELESNALGQFPGAVYRSQSGSAIHWQPWTRETLERAEAAQRLVLAVVAMPQQPGFQSVLGALDADPTLVSAINDNYVPVLIDGDAARDVGLLTADLCSEIKRGLQLPLFIWMTPEADPVAWIPVGEATTVAEVFNQSHSMVARMWSEDRAYVLKNSSLDSANRRERIGERRNAKVMSEAPADDALKAIRQLNSLYDPMSRSFDEVGGLFPAGALDLLATTATQPGVPAETRGRCLETTRELLIDLLPSAMFDPLDGGVFTSRRGSSWALPSFSRDCVSQARSAVALIAAYRATGEARALEQALGMIAFAEKSFSTTEGLFSAGLTQETDPASWLWSIEDIEKELPADDVGWWIKATGMQGLGNLPSEVDPRREYFRKNSLAMSLSPTEIAATLSEPLETFIPRFEATRKILLKARSARLGPMTRDDTSHAGATFRMVSAYAAAYGVTGKEEFRKKSVELLEKARVAFSDGPRLRVFSREAPASLGAARAFIYALALQSALDVAAISSDGKWLDWSQNLATTAAELFTADGFLKECPKDSNLIDLPVTDLVMLFEDSTAGLVSFAECRLGERELPMVRTFSELATPLPTHSMQRPVLHTDLLQATVAREFKVTIIAGEGISGEMRTAVERLPMRMIQRRTAKPGDEIPRGSVMVRYSTGEPRLATSVQELMEAVTPAPPQP